MRITTRWTGGLIIAIVLALSGTRVFAQYDYYTAAGTAASLQDELKTAITHAGFAAKYDSLNEVTLHLHHTLNCLVGPNGKMFDASAGNPCQGGHGILADISDAGKAKYNQAWWAAQLAHEAITTKNLDQARAAGHIIALALTSVASK
jgi:hypothetical protein